MIVELECLVCKNRRLHSEPDCECNGDVMPANRRATSQAPRIRLNSTLYGCYGVCGRPATRSKCTFSEHHNSRTSSPASRNVCADRLRFSVPPLLWIANAESDKVQALQVRLGKDSRRLVGAVWGDWVALRPLQERSNPHASTLERNRSSFYEGDRDRDRINRGYLIFRGIGAGFIRRKPQPDNLSPQSLESGR
jgi:hypothetical protein